MISIIIPCYNCEKYLHRAIESVFSQTYSDYEIILVNNNSTDNTINIINEYKKKYPDIIKVLHENKVGAPAARNSAPGAVVVVSRSESRSSSAVVSQRDIRSSSARTTGTDQRAGVSAP